MHFFELFHQGRTLSNRSNLFLKHTLALTNMIKYLFYIRISSKIDHALVFWFSFGQPINKVNYFNIIIFLFNMSPSIEEFKVPNSVRIYIHVTNY